MRTFEPREKRDGRRRSRRSSLPEEVTRDSSTGRPEVRDHGLKKLWIELQQSRSCMMGLPSFLFEISFSVAC